MLEFDTLGMEEKKRKFPWEVAGPAVGIFLILWVVFWFNYFGVINLGKFFSFLPIKSEQSATNNTKSTSVILVCPTSRDFCTSAKIVEGGDFTGLGYNLPKNTVVRAAFTGTLSNQPKVAGRSEGQPLLYLRDERGNEAIYSYYGSVSTEVLDQPVFEGTEIGRIGDGTFPPYPPLSGLNFLFTVKSGGKAVPLDPNQFRE